MEKTALDLPWVEKYRPHRLSDGVGQVDIAKRLQSYAQHRNMPNLLFSGPAGVGKTSSAVALARELYGEGFQQNFLELNASDERGIDVVRNTIKDFARTLAFDAHHKIIFLDESDALTSDAQQALRRTMEKYTKTARFVLSCVTPDTRIAMPEETETTIGEFMEEFGQKRKAQILNVEDNSGSSKEDLVLCAIQLNPKSIGKRVFELLTNTGRKLKVTEDHPLLTNNGWKKAGELKEGEKIVILPTLEGTDWPKESFPLVGLNGFKEFLKCAELSDGYKTLGDAESFDELCTQDKKKVVNRGIQLYQTIQSNQGLTPREMNIFEIVKMEPNITRKSIQEKMSLSRIRTVQLLKEVEKKGFIKRKVSKKVHGFAVANTQPLAIRNFQDIKNVLKKEFNIKISYANTKKHLEKNDLPFKGFADYSLKELENRGLLQLRIDSVQTSPLIRIMGFIFGDGHITNNRQRIIFTGNEIALREVKKDLRKLGFEGSPIAHKTLRNTIRGREFVGTTTFFHVDSKPFALLLEFLGAPIGDKIVTPYQVPEVVANGNRLIKREFLRALFGCEGYSPKIKKKNFEAVTVRMHKSSELRKNMEEFFDQISQLLLEFDVDSYAHIEPLGYVRKDGKRPECHSLILGSSNENLFKFFSRVGYAFEKEKIQKARLAGEYLRHKAYCLQQQKNVATAIVASLSYGLTKRKIAKEFNTSVDFVVNQSQNKPVRSRRGFPSFKEWKTSYHYKEGLVLNEIIYIKEVQEPLVMDITCLNNHNFIANGIVSHNCNYSSKIIEPIQSRCVVFRFKPLSAKEVEEKIRQVCKSEGVSIDDKAIEAIIYVSQGDMRKAINILQSAASLEKKVGESTVYNVSSRARPEEVKEMIHLALNAEFLEARKKLDSLLYDHGMSGEDVINQLYREMISMPEKELDGKTKIALVDTIGEYNFRIVEGANERIQLEALLAQFMKHKK